MDGSDTLNKTSWFNHFIEIIYSSVGEVIFFNFLPILYYIFTVSYNGNHNYRLGNIRI